MNTLFWARLHGGSTHFPIVLAVVSLTCAVAARVTRSDLRRSELHRVGLWALWLAALCSCGAALSGLILSKWSAIGTGRLARHHLFVWPGFSLLVGLAVWRVAAPSLGSRRLETAYLLILSAVSLCIMIAAFWGGELILGNA